MKKWAALATQADRCLEIFNGSTDFDPEEPSEIPQIRQFDAMLSLIGAFAVISYKFNCAVVAPELKLAVTPQKDENRRRVGCRIERGGPEDIFGYEIDLSKKSDGGFRIENRNKEGTVYGFAEYYVCPKGPLRLSYQGHVLTPGLVAELHCTWLVSAF